MGPILKTGLLLFIVSFCMDNVDRPVMLSFTSCEGKHFIGCHLHHAPQMHFKMDCQYRCMHPFMWTNLCYLFSQVRLNQQKECIQGYIDATSEIGCFGYFYVNQNALDPNTQSIPHWSGFHRRGIPAKPDFNVGGMGAGCVFGHISLVWHCFCMWSVKWVGGSGWAPPSLKPGLITGILPRRVQRLFQRLFSLWWTRNACHYAICWRSGDWCREGGRLFTSFCTTRSPRYEKGLLFPCVLLFVFVQIGCDSLKRVNRFKCQQVEWGPSICITLWHFSWMHMLAHVSNIRTDGSGNCRCATISTRLLWHIWVCSQTSCLYAFCFHLHF